MQLTTHENESFDVYLVGDENAERGVLILHDWWGMLDYNKDCADHFQDLKCQALVIDLYDGKHPQNTKEASEYTHSLDQDVLNRKISTALNYLKRDDRKIAVLGWSFGGLQAQYAAINFPDLVDVLVLYYCRIVLNKQNIDSLNVPVLAIFAETEPTWPDKQAALESLMSSADKVLECHSYDADHGFANPDGIRYDDVATEEAREVVLDFLNRYF